VRSQSKADKIKALYTGLPHGALDFAIVEDISKKSAFDEAVKSEPGFDAVIHTASPFQLEVTKPEDLLDPAINGTIGILQAIKKHAPTIKRVVCGPKRAILTMCSY
jgi:nucleoside-diphosphate-sugar epimerase